MKTLLLLFLTFLIAILSSCSDEKKGHYLTDNNLNLLEDSISPNDKFKYFTYQFDNGGLGYSRVFWAATKKTNDAINLLDYKIPDGYKIVGWDENSKLILQEWEPYYYKAEEVNLITGSHFRNIELIVKEIKTVPNNGEHP